MPQLKANQSVTSVQENKLFRARLMDLFKPMQFVRVINVDDETYEWQYMPADGEDESFTDQGSVRVITGRKSFTANFSGVISGNEQSWSIEPGQTEVLLGENAYLMIEGLAKKMVTKNYLVKNGEFVVGKAGRSFNWNDGKTQEDMIAKIFLGIEDPRFNDTPRTTTTPAKTRA